MANCLFIQCAYMSIHFKYTREYRQIFFVNQSISIVITQEH